MVCFDGFLVEPRLLLLLLAEVGDLVRGLYSAAHDYITVLRPHWRHCWTLLAQDLLLWPDCPSNWCSLATPQLLSIAVLAAISRSQYLLWLGAVENVILLGQPRCVGAAGQQSLVTQLGRAGQYYTVLSVTPQSGYPLLGRAYGGR